MSDDARGPGFVTGLLFGALIGAAIAMVLAPQAGEDTRDLLRAKAREASGRLRDAAEDVTSTDLLARGRQIVEEAKARFDAAAQQTGGEPQERSAHDNEA